MFLIEADNEATRHLLLGVFCSEMLFESYVPHIHSEKVLQPMNLSLWRRGMCTPLSHYIYIFTIAKNGGNVNDHIDVSHEKAHDKNTIGFQKNT